MWKNRLFRISIFRLSVSENSKLQLVNTHVITCGNWVTWTRISAWGLKLQLRKSKRRSPDKLHQHQNGSCSSAQITKLVSWEVCSTECGDTHGGSSRADDWCDTATDQARSDPIDAEVDALAAHRRQRARATIDFLRGSADEWQSALLLCQCKSMLTLKLMRLHACNAHCSFYAAIVVSLISPSNDGQSKLITLLCFSNSVFSILLQFVLLFLLLMPVSYTVANAFCRLLFFCCCFLVV